MLRRLTFPEGFHSKFKNKVKEGVIILEDVIVENFPILGKFSTIISSSIFSWSFFLSSSSGTPIDRKSVV